MAGNQFLILLVLHALLSGGVLAVYIDVPSIHEPTDLDIGTRTFDGLSDGNNDEGLLVSADKENKPSVSLTIAMKPMIDMRGFPDLNNNCYKGAGYYRNKTDCTQFYRCVDFFNNTRYTYFRFMCSPNEVFDEYLFICHFAHLARPKCNETTTSTTTTSTTTTTTQRPICIGSDCPKPVPPPCVGSSCGNNGTDCTGKTCANITTSTTTTTTPKTPTRNKSNEFLFVIDEPTNKDTESQDLSVIVSEELAVLTPASQNIVIVINEGRNVTISISSRSLLVIKTEGVGVGAIITSVINGLTKGSSKAVVPSGSSVSIVTLDAFGTSIKRETILKANSEVTIKLPENVLVGRVTWDNEGRLRKVGQWIYSFVYIYQINQITRFTVLSRFFKASSLFSYTASQGIDRQGNYVSALIVASNSSVSDTKKSGFVVKGEQEVGIIPPGNNGTIVIKGGYAEETLTVNVTPGRAVIINIPAGSEGHVTNLEQKLYTSSTSELKFPAGSTVSIVRVANDGSTTIEKSGIVLKTTSLLQVGGRTVVGIIRRTEGNNVVGIGGFDFKILPLDHADKTDVRLGVIVHCSSSSGSTNESLSNSTAILRVGIQRVLDIPSSNWEQGAVLDANTIYLALGKGDYTITSNGTDYTLTLTDDNEFFVIQTNEGPGEGTRSREITFPSGATFGTQTILTDGTLSELVENEVFVFQSPTTVLLPPGFTIGKLKLNTDQVIAGLGEDVVIDPQQFVLVYNSSSVAKIAVFHYLNSFDIDESAVTSSANLEVDPSRKTLAALIPLGLRSLLNAAEDIVVPSGSLLAVIPPGGMGSIEASNTRIEILPGSFLLLNSSSDVTVTQLIGGRKASKASRITIGSYHSMGIFTINSQNRKLEGKWETFPEDISIAPKEGSIIGTVRIRSGKVVAIGSAKLVVRKIQTVGGHVGLIDLSKRYIPDDDPKLVLGVDSIPRNESPLEALTIASGELFGFIVQWDVENLSIGGQQVDLQANQLYLIVPNEAAGEVSNVANKAFTTSSSVVTLKSSTTIYKAERGSGGFVVLKNKEHTVIETTTDAIMLLPAGTLVGHVTGENPVESAGEWKLGYFLITSEETSRLEVVPVASNVNSARARLESSSEGFPKRNTASISGIVAVGKAKNDSYETIKVAEEQEFGIVPPVNTSGSKVTLLETSSEKVLPFEIPSGSMMLVKLPKGSSAGSASLMKQLFTTAGTSILMPKGSKFYKVQIGIDGKRSLNEIFEAESDVKINTPERSMVGIVEHIEGSVVKFGTFSFNVQRVMSENGVVHLGVINLAKKVVGDSDDSTALISGAVRIGQEAFIKPQDSSTSLPIEIALNTEYVVEGEGDVFISSEQNNSPRSTAIIALKTGFLLSIEAVSQPGEARGVINECIASSANSLTFPAGAKISIYRIQPSAHGKLTKLSGARRTFDTDSSTVVKLPNNSIFGKLKLDADGTFVGIGDNITADPGQQVLEQFPTDDTALTLVRSLLVFQFTRDFNTKSSIASSRNVNVQPEDDTLVAIIPLGVREQLTSLIKPIEKYPVRKKVTLAVIPPWSEVTSGQKLTYGTGSVTLYAGDVYVLEIKAGNVTVTNWRGKRLSTKETVISFSRVDAAGVYRINSSSGELVQRSNVNLPDGLETALLGTNSGGSLRVPADSVLGDLSVVNSRVVAIGNAPFAIKSIENNEGAAIGVINLSDNYSNSKLGDSFETNDASSDVEQTIYCPASKESPTLNRYAYDCSRLVHCSRNQDGDDRRVELYVMPCAAGLAFDTEKSTCVKRDVALDCNDDDDVIEDEAASREVAAAFVMTCSGGLFTYPINAKHFYQCSIDADEDYVRLNVYSCADGLVFDERQKQCLKRDEAYVVQPNLLLRSPDAVFNEGQSVENFTILFNEFSVQFRNCTLSIGTV